MGLFKSIFNRYFSRAHHIPANPYNPHAWIIGEPNLGKGCWIGPFTVIDGSGGLEIGENTTISSGTHIYTHSAVARNVSKREHPELDRRAVKIGCCCHIGPNSTVLMGVKIGNNVVIGAGSVILENTEIPDNAVMAGNPAKLISNNSGKLWKEKCAE